MAVPSRSATVTWPRAIVPVLTRSRSLRWKRLLRPRHDVHTLSSSTTRKSDSRWCSDTTTSATGSCSLTAARRPSSSKRSTSRFSTTLTHCHQHHSIDHSGRVQWKVWPLDGARALLCMCVCSVHILCVCTCAYVCLSVFTGGGVGVVVYLWVCCATHREKDTSCVVSFLYRLRKRTRSTVL
uniref:Uncharacterized protein n=1 Tax=Anopheles farauti TaxID=69004 RepID=A0A182QXG0_9DIPT